MKTLGARLSWAMKQAGGIGPRPLGNVCGVPPDTIKRVRAGENASPGAAKLVTLAGVLGQPLAWLISGDGTRNEWSTAHKAEFPEGRTRYGKAYAQAFRELWTKHKMSIPEGLTFFVEAFHEGEPITKEHIVELVLAVRSGEGERVGRDEG